MTQDQQFDANITAIGQMLEERRRLLRRNDGAELYNLCRNLLSHSKVRTAAPLSMQLLEEACDRYRRDNYEQQLAAVAKEMSNA